MSEFKNMPLPQAPEGEGTRFAKAHHILLFFVGAVLLVWILSGFYQVKADEIAIVERLGQYVSTPEGKAVQVEQGLHYHLPWPIDRVHKISVQQTATLRVDAFDSTPAEYAEMRQTLLLQRVPSDAISAVFDPYLITADKSVVHMDISVVYRINDPEAWLNTISHSSVAPDAPDDARKQFFQQIVQHAMITQVSHMPLQNVLFTDLQTLRTTMLNTLQEALQLQDPGVPGGKLGLGVQVQTVEIVNVRPPARVKQAFDDVLRARSNRETQIANAQGEYNAAVTKAKSEQTTLLIQAETYKKQTVEASRGEANRFAEVLTQFNNAPDVARWNIFVDAVNSVSGNSRRIIFAQPGQHVTVTVDPPQYDAGQVQPK